MKLWFIYASANDTAHSLHRMDLFRQIIVLNNVFQCLIGHPDYQKYKLHPATLAFGGDHLMVFYWLERYVGAWNVLWRKRKTQPHGLTSWIKEVYEQYEKPPTASWRKSPAFYLIKEQTEWHLHTRYLYYKRAQAKGKMSLRHPTILNMERQIKNLPTKYRWPRPPGKKEPDLQSITYTTEVMQRMREPL